MKKLDARGILHHLVPLLAVVFLVGIGGAYFVLRAHAAALDGAIESGYGGVCLADPNASKTAGSPVDIQKCGGAADSQFWQAANGDETIRINGLCLAPAGGASANNGAAVQLLSCKANAGQQWVTQNGELADVATKLCLSVAGSSSGTNAQLANCSSDTGEQWTIPSPSTDMLGSSGQIFSGTGQGLCADDKNDSRSPGTPAQLSPCNGKSSQLWSLFGDETVRIHGNCLATANNGQDAGTKVVVAGCTNSSSEAWVQGSSGTVINEASGKCLDAGMSTAGTQLQISTCDTTSKAQSWTLPANGSKPITQYITIAPGVTVYVGPKPTATQVALPTQAQAQASQSAVQAAATQAAQQHDLTYIIDTTKGNVSCGKLISTYAKQLMGCN